MKKKKLKIIQVYIIHNLQQIILFFNKITNNKISIKMLTINLRIISLMNNQLTNLIITIIIINNLNQIKLII